jgi:capsid protein
MARVQYAPLVGSSTCFASPYEWMLGEAVARGLIAAPGFFDDPIVKAAWCEAQWTGPTMGQLNPTDEMNALQTAIDMRIRSRQEIAVEQYGTDWNRTVEQLAEERAILTDRGLDSEDLSQRFEPPVPAGGAQPAPAKHQNRTPPEKP